MVSGSAPPLPLIADGLPLLVRNPFSGRRSAVSGRGEVEKRQKEKRKLKPVEILQCSKEKRKLSLQQKSLMSDD
ncbi:hypothetical protein CDL15_Pgr011049 [Punica granatum]|nr:hypothetical protein CDL15_Pgr011049 [Punica granatum]